MNIKHDEVNTTQ